MNRNFPGGKPPQKKSGIQVSMAFVILLCVTVFLLIVSLVTMAVLLASDPPAPSGNGGGGGGNGGGGTKAPVSMTDTPTQPIKKPEPTNLSRSNYSVSVPEGVQAIEGISSQAAILLDLDNYSTIAAKNATTKIYPASMTKVMTLLVACENIQNLNELLTVTAEQVKYQADHGGGLTAGPARCSTWWRRHAGEWACWCTGRQDPASR